MPCQLESECICSPQSKADCEFWVPSQHSKYYRCNRWRQYRMSCPLKVEACPSCEHYAMARQKQKFISIKIKLKGLPDSRFIRDQIDVFGITQD